MKYIIKIMMILLAVFVLVFLFILRISYITIDGVKKEKDKDIRYCNIDIDDEGNINVNEVIKVTDGWKSTDYEIELFSYLENNKIQYIKDIKVFVDGKEVLDSNKVSQLNLEERIELRYYKDYSYHQDRIKVSGLDDYEHYINVQYKISQKIIDQYNNVSILKAKKNYDFLDYKIKINFPRSINLFKTDTKKAKVNKIQNNCYEIDMTKTKKMISKEYVEVRFDKDIVKNPTIINQEYSVLKKLESKPGRAFEFLIKITFIFTIVSVIVVKILTNRRIIYKNSIKSTKVVLDPILAESIIDGRMNTKELIMACIMDLVYRKNIEVLDNNIIKINNLENMKKYEREIVELVFENSKTTSFEKLKNVFSLDESGTKKFYNRLNMIKKEIKEYFFEEKIYSENGEKILTFIKDISLLNIMMYVFFVWLFFLNQKVNTIAFFLSIIIVIMSIILWRKCRIPCLTNKGIIEYNKAYALKKYIKEYSLMEQREMDGVQVWDRYLAYACAFGISTKIIDKIDEGTMKANILYQFFTSGQEYIIE